MQSENPNNPLLQVVKEKKRIQNVKFLKAETNSFFFEGS